MEENSELIEKLSELRQIRESLELEGDGKRHDHKNEQFRGKLEGLLDLTQQKLKLSGEGDAHVKAKAVLCWIEGSARNFDPEIDPSAETLLTRALILDPQLGNSTDAQLQLGQISLKNGDLKTAETFFEKCADCTDRSVVKRAKRHLSEIFITKADAKTGPDKNPFLGKAEKLASEALKLDTSDKSSWGYLANAYFAQFAHNPLSDAVRKAATAYELAFQDTAARLSPNFCINYARILLFQERFEEATKHLCKSQELLAMSPGVESSEVNHIFEEATNLLEKCSKSVAERASMKDKDFRKLIANDKFNSRFLGPYKNRPNIVHLAHLKDKPILSKPELDRKRDEVCLVKVIDPRIVARSTLGLHYSAIADTEGFVCVLSVFEPEKDEVLFQKGDTIALKNPKLSPHNFKVSRGVTAKSEGQHRAEFNFCLIREHNYKSLVVNGFEVGKKCNGSCPDGCC